MKYLISILIIIYAPIITFGQEDSSKYQFDLEFKARLSNAAIKYNDNDIPEFINDYILAPSVNFKFKRHSFFIAYDFITSKGYLMTGYQYYWSQLFNERLILFFPADFLYKSIETTEKSETTIIISDKTYLRGNIGIGIKYLLWKGLYISSQSGIGQNIIKTNYNKSINGILINSHINSDLTLNLYFQIGLGYSIKARTGSD